MTFPLPEYSKNHINKIGNILRANVKVEQLTEALKTLTNWRACHGYPVNTFQATIRKRLKRLSFQDTIVAQRLKRLPTIIKKLKRFKKMQLARMQDIGGLRVVLSTLKEVSLFKDLYLNDKKFQHELVSLDDYIENPKIDGYRSVHLVYRYKNPIKPEYNGLLIELQIRTKLQHTWATAVETMGTYLGQALKSGEGEKKWKDFFSLTSSAFAYMEKTKAVPNYSHLDRDKTFVAVSHIENDIQALKVMEGYSDALRVIEERKGKSSYYHLITLNSIEGTVQVKSYAKADIAKAASDYTEAETKAANGENIEPVLVSAGDLHSLKRAYPNYFLDVKEFMKKIEGIIIDK